jgi:hypothetical protein
MGSSDVDGFLLDGIGEYKSSCYYTIVECDLCWLELVSFWRRKLKCTFNSRSIDSWHNSEMCGKKLKENHK